MDRRSIRRNPDEFREYIGKRPGMSTLQYRSASCSWLLQSLEHLSGNHLRIYIRFGTVNFADIFDICRTGSCIYLPCTVSTSDNGFCNGNPRIVVAEDSGIFFISWWIRGNFTKFYMVSVIRWLKKYNTVFSIQIFSTDSMAFRQFPSFRPISAITQKPCGSIKSYRLHIL